MQVFFSGHNSCLNRGCEAFVRTTAEAIRGRWPSVRINMPTNTPAYDAGALSTMGDCLHPQARQPGLVERVVVHAQQRRGLAVRSVWPGPVPAAWHQAHAAADLVIAVGGDTYSLDYGVPGAIAGFDGTAASRGVPVVLWGASVGPFRTLPAYERALAQSLARYRLIGARESLTRAYLEGELGLGNVVGMVDPAFDLSPEALPCDDGTLQQLAGARRVIGLNLSHLIATRAGGEPALATEVGHWLRCVLGDPQTRVVFIPHVADRHRDARGDAALMRRLVAAAGLSATQAKRVVHAGDDWRAGQYKALVGRCDVLIAARTHLTIAGFSQGVPTVSLGYSQKALGLNRDIYGTERFHMPVDGMSAAALQTGLEAALEASATMSAQSLQYTRTGLERNQAILSRFSA